MALTLTDKKAIVTSVNEIAQDAISVVAAEYRGLTVSDMTRLRSQARKQGVQIHIIRNTLAKRAFEGTRFECMNDSLVGPLVLAFAQDAPSAAARLLRDFAKDNEALKVKVLSIGDVAHGPEHLEAIASLPTKEEALAKLLYVLKAPIEKFVRTLNEPVAKMVRTVDAVRMQKESA